MCGSAESSLTVHTLPMALLLLSYGQNFYQVPLQRAWDTMETPGFITLLYLMYSLPKQEGIGSLPTVNWVMASCFVGHHC